MKVELELPAEIAWIWKMYATILEDTVEHLLTHKLIEEGGDLGDGYILGEEISSVYKLKSGAGTGSEPAPSS